MIPYLERVKNIREKFRVLRKMSTHELGELDSDFNLNVLTDEKAYAIAVLTKEEFDLLFKRKKT